MSEIKFAKYRSFYKTLPPMVDVVYESGRVFTYSEDELPKTVRAYLREARCYYEHDCYDRHTFVYVPRNSTGRV